MISGPTQICVFKAILDDLAAKGLNRDKPGIR